MSGKPQTVVLLLAIGVTLTVCLVVSTSRTDRSGRIGFTSDRDSLSRDTDLSWSPDCKKIVFGSGGNTGPQIYAMNPDGTGQTRLSTSSGSHFFPSWSPDGTKVVFMFVDPGSADAIFRVYTMDADGSNYHDISITEFDNGWPAWSPGGEEIAWSLSDHICVVDTDGENARILDVWGFSLAWSPDGEKIAFNSSSGGIGVVDLSNGKVKRLIPYGFSPSWSPDGSKIAFDSEQEGNTDIFVMDTEGGNIQRLTIDIANDRSPCWSPDGTKIAFVSNRDSNNEIYIMNADGTNQKNVTNNAADDRDPDWCCQTLSLPIESIQPGRGSHTSFSLEGFLSWKLIIPAVSLMIFLISFLVRRTIQRKK
jgi:Tol biopolymer transport system component